MIGDLLVGVMLRFSTNGIFTMERLNAATRGANLSLERSLGLITAQNSALLRHEEALRRVNMRYRELRALVAGGAALGGAALIGASIADAAKLQLAMSSVRLSSNASPSQAAALQQLVLRVSGMTAQSASTTAQEMATASRAGLGSYHRLNALFPLLAKFADVQYFQAKARGQSLPVTEAVSIGTQFAHLFQAYTPASMSNMLEWLTKVQNIQPEAMQRLLMQGKYFIPLARTLGMTTPQAFTLLAAMGQTGFLRGRGGTSIENALYGAINSVAITGHLQTAKAKALEALGVISPTGKSLVDTAHGGKLDWHKFTAALDHAARTLDPTTYASLLVAALNKQATQFMSVYTSPLVQGQLAFIQHSLIAQGNHPIERAFRRIVGGDTIPAFQKAWTNLQNVGIQLGSTLLPAVTAGLNALATALQGIVAWLGTHPRAAFGITMGALAAVAAAATYAARQLWMLNESITMLGNMAAARSGESVFSKIGGFLFGTPAIEGEKDAFTGLPLVGSTGRAAKRGIFSWLKDALAPIGGFFMRFLGPIGEFVAKIIPALMDFAGDAVPIVGWIVAAVSALSGLVGLVANSPAIAVAVSNWWVKNQYGIGEQIGAITGDIVRMFVRMFQGVVAATGAATGAFFRNIGDLVTPGGVSDLTLRMALSAQHAGQRFALQPGHSFSAGLSSGYYQHVNGLEDVAPSHSSPAPIVVNIHHLHLSGDHAFENFLRLPQRTSGRATASPFGSGFAAHVLGTSF